MGSNSTEGRRNSVPDLFAGRRAAVFELAFVPFREPLDDKDLEAFAFKRKDLEATGARLVVFLEAFPLGLLFVVIDAATYKVIGPSKSRTGKDAACDLLIIGRPIAVIRPDLESLVSNRWFAAWECPRLRVSLQAAMFCSPVQ